MVLEDTVERSVDWGSVKTWWNFIGLCVLVAVFLAICNVALTYAVRLALEFFDIGSLFGIARPDVSDWVNRMTCSLAVSAALLLFLWFAVQRTAGPLARSAVPDNFPMHMFETGKSNNIGWLFVIVALNGLIGIALSPLTGGRISITEAEPNPMGFSTVALLICKDGLMALFWRALAQDRSSNDAVSVRSSWFAHYPGRAIAILAAIGMIFYMLTPVLAWSLAWL